jgi:hypothetical protein
LFVVVDFLILLAQYFMVEIWFEVEDFHHETVALSSFAKAIGLLIGAFTQKKQKQLWKINNWI